MDKYEKFKIFARDLTLLCRKHGIYIEDGGVWGTYLNILNDPNIEYTVNKNEEFFYGQLMPKSDVETYGTGEYESILIDENVM